MLLTVSGALHAAPEEDYLAVAVQTARWIESTAVSTPYGQAWPVKPPDPEVSPDLYSGVAGVVLFFVELYQVTENRLFLRTAREGADYLLGWLRREGRSADPGLYTGVAGVGFVLQETYKVSRDYRFLRGARECVRLLHESSRRAGRGVEWNDKTDIISGSAGIGLFLIYASRELEDPASLGLATRAGERLLELAVPSEKGLKWAMEPAADRFMPNFSHGTAGIAYFLATLASATGTSGFGRGAEAGAEYLLSVATTEGDACLIFHHEPGGEDLYYLGWCHGPVGTSRLFYRLWRSTGDPKWMEWVRRSARGIIQSGVPEPQTPGFWNNVGQCCGSAGIGDFFLDLYRVTRDGGFLNFSRQLARDILSRADRSGAGPKWVQAENREHPEELVAQTGYMQGAAGIGMLFVHLDAQSKSRRKTIVFPDSPY